MSFTVDICGKAMAGMIFFGPGLAAAEGTLQAGLSASLLDLLEDPPWKTMGFSDVETDLGRHFRVCLMLDEPRKSWELFFRSTIQTRPSVS